MLPAKKLSGALRLLAGRLAHKSSSKFSSTSAKRELEIFNVLREADTFYYHRQPSCIVCQQHGQRVIGTIVD